MRSRSEKPAVFVNCPFDEFYQPLMRAMVFAVIDCGFEAHCAEEINDAGLGRLQKVVELIKTCKFGIHDISMVKLDPKTGLPRFNMPFELGLFFGASAYDRRQKEKKCLIFAHDDPHYRDCLSDISSRDVQVHNNDPRIAIQKIRNFLSPHNAEKVPGDVTVWNHYREFQAQLPALCDRLGLSPSDLIFRDYINVALCWLQENAPPTA